MNALCEVRRPMRIAAWVMVGLCLAGCGRTKAQDEQAERERQRPWPDRLWQAAYTNYQVPEGQRQECLHRQIFTTEGPVEWGTYETQDTNSSYGGFTKNVGMNSQSALWVDGVEIATLIPRRSGIGQTDKKTGAFMLVKSNLDSVLFQDIREHLLQPKERNLKNMRSSIVEHTATLEEARMKNDAQWVAAELATIELSKRELERIERLFYEFDVGVPDSFAYARETSASNYTLEASQPRHAYDAILRRNGLVYYFTVDYIDKGEDAAAHRNHFINLIRAFRPRQLYEIPTERGLCFPLGFIADDGTRKFKIAAALRYVDTPSVMYEFSTGLVNPERGSEATWIIAGMRRLEGPIGYRQEEFDHALVKRVGGEDARLGLLEASRGGVVLNLAKPGEPPAWSYSVYTGYGGYSDSQVLPYFIVDMRSFTKVHAPELKDNPPPFEESMGRLQRLLASVHLRPTVPLMPELQQAPKP